MKSLPPQRGGGSYAKKFIAVTQQRKIEAKEREFASALQTQMEKLDDILTRHGGQQQRFTNDGGGALTQRTTVIEKREQYAEVKNQTRNSRSPSTSALVAPLSASSHRAATRSTSATTHHRHEQRELSPIRVRRPTSGTTATPQRGSAPRKPTAVEQLASRRVSCLKHKERETPLALPLSCPPPDDAGVSTRRPNFHASSVSPIHSERSASPYPTLHPVTAGPCHSLHETSEDVQIETNVLQETLRPAAGPGATLPLGNDFVTPITQLRSAPELPYSPAVNPVVSESATSVLGGVTSYYFTSQYPAVTAQERSCSAATATTTRTTSPTQSHRQREEAYKLERELLILSARKAMMQDELRIMQMTLRPTESAAELSQQHY